MSETQDTSLDISRMTLLMKAILQSLFMLVILGACFFLPAWTFEYWQAWVYIGVFYSMMLSNLIYLVINDPELLQRRLDRNEDRPAQKWYIAIGNLSIIPIYLLPGFDFRFEISHVHWLIIVIADIIFGISYLLFVWVLKTNSFAARTIKVDKEKQVVITTGPYAIVRHPLYLAAGIMFGISPICLGSWLGLISTPFLIILMAVRIKDEEKMLEEELTGYVEYKQKVKYRIVLGLW